MVPLDKMIGYVATGSAAILVLLATAKKALDVLRTGIDIRTGISTTRKNSVTLAIDRETLKGMKQSIIHPNADQVAQSNIAKQMFEEGQAARQTLFAAIRRNLTLILLGSVLITVGAPDRAVLATACVYALLVLGFVLLPGVEMRKTDAAAQ